MKKTLKFISISHQTANMATRQAFHLTDADLPKLLEYFKSECQLQGAIILATCNRTEVYFETMTTTTDDLLLAFLNFIKVDASFKTYFEKGETTDVTVNHLLEVAGGLRSMVIGDAQIINQIKRAYQISAQHQLQGKRLERAMQTMFKMHKRIQNETNFRTGTASLSYLGLRLCKQEFGKSIKEKSLLIVGAGEISRDVAKYAHKFNFKQIAIVNRTKSKAEAVAKEHDYITEDWDDLETLAADKYDVIVTGVSNCVNLFDANLGCNTPKVFVDLAMPANVDKDLAKQKDVKVINLDVLQVATQKVEEDRLNAVTEVKAIIADEIEKYNEWLAKVPGNESLNHLKSYVQMLLQKEIEEQFGATLTQEVKEQFVQKVSKSFVKQPAISMNKLSMHQEAAEVLNKLFVPS